MEKFVSDNSIQYLPLDQCIHGSLYLIYSRNLSLGVYNKNTQSFYGIRYKFGQRFIDDEYSWDLGEPYGTCKPIKYLEQSPFTFVGKVIENETWKHQKIEDTKELFDWLDDRLVYYKEEIEKL